VFENAIVWQVNLFFNSIKEVLFNVKLLKNNCLKKITIFINKLKLCRGIIIY